MKDCKLIILNHYDFSNDKGEQIQGSKCKVGKGKYAIDISFKGNGLFKLELLKEYKCDLFIDENLKINLTNVY